jgi:hypothetical protein
VRFHASLPITLSAMFPAKREFSVTCLALLGTYRESDFTGNSTNSAFFGIAKVARDLETRNSAHLR